MAYADLIKESMDLAYYSVRDRFYDVWEDTLFSVLGDAYSIFLPRIATNLSQISLAYVGPGRQAACIRDDWWRETARHVQEVDLYDIDERALLAGKKAFEALAGLSKTASVRTHLFDITQGLGDSCLQAAQDASADQIIKNLLRRATTVPGQAAPTAAGDSRRLTQTLAISEMVLGATGLAIFEILRPRLHLDDFFQLRAEFHSTVARGHLAWLATRIGPDGACILSTETSVSYGGGKIYPTFDQPLSTLLADTGFRIHRRLDGVWIDVPSGPEQHSHAISVWHLTRTQ